jgi:hypothetical protein
MWRYSIRIDDESRLASIITELWGRVEFYIHGNTEHLSSTDHVTIGVPVGRSVVNTDTSFVVPRSVMSSLKELRERYPDFNIVPFDPNSDYDSSVDVNGVEFLVADDSIIKNTHGYCSLTLPELSIRRFGESTGSMNIINRRTYVPPVIRPIPVSEFENGKSFEVMETVSFPKRTSVCYYLSAIGEPHYREKLDFLIQNLKHVRNEITDVDLLVNEYDDSSNDIQEHVKDLVKNVYVYKAKMRLGEFWSQSPLNARVQNYDSVLLILDDVRMCSNFSLNELIRKREEHKLDFISPMVLGGSHSYWHNNYRLTRNNRLEVFCYVMTPKTFRDYVSLHSPSNRFAWGVDLVYGHLNVRCGVYRPCEVQHYFRDSGDTTEAVLGANAFCRSHGYSTLEELSNSFPPIAEVLEV